MLETITEQKENKEAAAAKLKIPPHSNEAEQSVLGGLFLDTNAWDKVIERIGEQDFYSQKHRLIFRTIKELLDSEQPIDTVTVSEALKQKDRLASIGGEAYLFELANNIPTAANIGAYADIVRERSVFRQLIQAANDISESSFNPEGKSSIDVLDEAERKVFSIAEQNNRGDGPENVKTILPKVLERIDSLFHSDSAITGLATGFADLDAKTSGLQKGDMVIVAGRPSMGKTTFALNMAENAAIKEKKPVLVFSMEMPSEQLIMRMMSSLGMIDQHRVRSGQLEDDDWPRITSAMSILSESSFFIDDTPALSPAELRSRARRVAKEEGQLGLIVIDYLQLMQVPEAGDNRTNEISIISRSLKSLAKELSVPVIALSQLNRSLEQRNDKRPVMSDLRESGAIEQDADVILFIYRDEVYNDESPDKGKAEIIIGKQRNGPIGRVHLAFRGQFTKFDNLAPERYMSEMEE